MPSTMENECLQAKKRKHREFLLEEGAPQSPPTLTASLQGIPKAGKLCNRCSFLDFTEIFSQKVKTDLGSFIVNLQSSVEQLKASDCSLCQLFASVAPSDIDKEGVARTETCHIRVFSANRVFARFKKQDVMDYDTNLLGVMRIMIARANNGADDAYTKMLLSLEETGYLCPIDSNRLEPYLGTRIISPKAYSIQFTKDCISYCQFNHGKSCTLQSLGHMQSLRVIDCQERTIVEAPESCEYVALSYVWGTPEEEASGEVPTSPTLNGAPKVILDSITVTLDLGLRYLWIDRYCIDQLDIDDKHNQIRQMDLIYATAQVTIIAAAGSGPHYGLPGVRGTFRQHQASLAIGEHSLASTLPHPRWSVENSKWATRGWTYQEGLLSKRRLFFTDHQVSFECNGMHCAESRVEPRDAMHTKNKHGFKSAVPSGVLGWKAPGSKPWDIMSYVKEYHKRELSYPEDSLLAMEGIFHAFERSKRPLYHFMGVPILPPFAFLRGTTHHQVNRSAEEGFLIGLTWFHTKPGLRNQQFPSWSWAGWKGELAFTLVFNHEWLGRLSENEVWIENEDKSLTRFPGQDAPLSGDVLRPKSSRIFLHISARTFHCAIIHYVLDPRFPNQGRVWYQQPDGICAKISFTSDYDVLDVIHLDHEQEAGSFEPINIVQKTYTGIVFGDLEPLENCVVLIIEERGDHAQRIGVLQNRPRTTSGATPYSVASYDTYRSHRTAFYAWLKERPKRTIRLG